LPQKPPKIKRTKEEDYNITENKERTIECEKMQSKSAKCKI
jgi:hypothetical protein